MTEEERKQIQLYIRILLSGYPDKGNDVDTVITSLLMEVLMTGHNTLLANMVSPYPLTIRIINELDFIHETKTGCELTEKGKEFLRGSS